MRNELGPLSTPHGFWLEGAPTGPRGAPSQCSNNPASNICFCSTCGLLRAHGIYSTIYLPF